MNNQANRRGVVELCEPFLVNAAIFVGLILIDIFNSQNNLIPFHAIAGIVITLLTLALCKYNYNVIAWMFAIIPGVFLIITTAYYISKSRLYMAIEDTVENAYKTTAGGVKYVANRVGTAADVIGTNVSQFSDQAVANMNSINAYGTGLSTSAADAWNNIFQAQVNAGVDPAKAAVVATAAAGSPSVGTPEATTAAQAIATAPSVTMKGEYTYLCGDGTDPKSAPPESMADQCKYVSQQCSASTDPDCYDKLIGVVNAPATCLGLLATGGVAPSYTARNNCLACDPTLDSEALKLCRCTAMNNCPTAVMPSAAGTLAAPQAAMPVAATAQAFTNYRGTGY
jgi:hypothetical protein